MHPFLFGVCCFCFLGCLVLLWVFLFRTSTPPAPQDPPILLKYTDLSNSWKFTTKYRYAYKNFINGIQGPYHSSLLVVPANTTQKANPKIQLDVSVNDKYEFVLERAFDQGPFLQLPSSWVQANGTFVDNLQAPLVSDWITVLNVYGATSGVSQHAQYTYQWVEAQTLQDEVSNLNQDTVVTVLFGENIVPVFRLKLEFSYPNFQIQHLRSTPNQSLQPYTPHILLEDGIYVDKTQIKQPSAPIAQPTSAPSTIRVAYRYVLSVPNTGQSKVQGPNSSYSTQTGSHFQFEPPPADFQVEFIDQQNNIINGTIFNSNIFVLDIQEEQKKKKQDTHTHTHTKK